MPIVGVEGGRINLVPVDFVAAALDHLAHPEEGDGRCYHLTDPEPYRVGDVFGLFLNAAHAPRPAMRINAALFNLVPAAVVQGLWALTPVRRIAKASMNDLGLPPDIFTFLNYPTRFDSREAERLLRPTGITVPRLENYAWRLWDYWERHLNSDLHVDRSLRGKVADRVVVITGGSPHFSAYVASKAALEAWTRCAAAEYLDRGIAFTTVNMPLTRTPMIAPTKFYNSIPALTPEEAADLVGKSIVERHATRLGIFGQVVGALAPHLGQIINNTMFRMFPDLATAQGSKVPQEPTADQAAVTQLMRGLHF